MIRRHCGCVWVGLLGLLPALGCASGQNDTASHNLLPQLTSSGIKAPKDKGELPPDEAAKANLATAEAFEKSGNPLDALRHYEMARSNDPRLNSKVCRNIARLYDQIGDAQRAMVAYKQCQIETPRDPDLLNDIGYCHYQQGQWQEAERWFRRTLDEAPQHQRATINLAMTLGQQGPSRYEDALETFKRVNTPAEAYVNMAFIYQTHGKWEEAKLAYRTALEIQPDLELARRALAKLEAPPAPKSPGAGTTVAATRPDPSLPGRPSVDALSSSTAALQPEAPARTEPNPGRDEPMALRKPEPPRGPARRLYPPEDRHVVPARALNGPPDLQQAVLQQQERDADLAELEAFVRKRQAEVPHQPPPPEPLLADPIKDKYDAAPGSPGSPRSPRPLRTLRATKPIVVGVPGEMGQRPANSAPVAVSFE